MSSISIFDIFKIGVGPSSSHTLGPWNAARQFIKAVKGADIEKIEVTLYGSLSKTGKGHGTDIAVVLGLLDYNPKTIDTQLIDSILTLVRDTKVISLYDQKVEFDMKRDIIFSQETKAAHPNTIIFSAYDSASLILEETYFSVGGGFIEREGEIINITDIKSCTYEMKNGKQVLDWVEKTGKDIADLVLANEMCLQNCDDVYSCISELYETMQRCAYRGCITAGVLPGGLNVKRRAKDLCEDLLQGQKFNSFEEWKALIVSNKRPFNYINKWISCIALAVNEENAAMGRVVTSPTNGAAGVVPAVLMYYDYFCSDIENHDINKFIMTAGLVGALFKQGATISAAVGGCQAEIGVSSAMAAAGLTQVQGGSPQQVLMAAEIAMEHHLGLTCDPVGGLVQVPCIERNTMGAMKAITASNLALVSNPAEAKVDFDTVVKTMKDTAEAMNHKYKETSEGGLAYNLPVIMPEC